MEKTGQCTQVSSREGVKGIPHEVDVLLRHRPSSISQAGILKRYWIDV
jgi:hypothetical protein